MWDEIGVWEGPFPVQVLPGHLCHKAQRPLGQGWQLRGPCGRLVAPAAALPSSRSQSAAVTPSSTASSTRATPAPSAPAAATATSPSPAPSSGNGASTAASPTQPIQLSDLQSILATMNVPAGPGGGQQGNTCSLALVKEPAAPMRSRWLSQAWHVARLAALCSVLPQRVSAERVTASRGAPSHLWPLTACARPLVDLASVLTPEIMAPILANADVQERLLPYLPSGESLPQTAEEIQNTLTSPQFQQVRRGLAAASAL